MTTNGRGPQAGFQPIDNGRPAAVSRLEAALNEQARLGDDFQQAVGTSAEQASYARLQVASRRVSECDRAVKVPSLGTSPR
jgi:hypothetical protein